MLKRLLTLSLSLLVFSGCFYNIKADQPIYMQKYGRSLTEDIAKAKAGDIEMQAELAEKYATGKGLKNNPDETLKWLKLAAKNGHMESQYKMGLFNHYLQTMLTSHDKARKWYKKAADQGHLKAQTALAIMNIIHYKADDKDAELVKKAAKKGSIKATRQLIIYYSKTNPEKAITSSKNFAAPLGYPKIDNFIFDENPQKIVNMMNTTSAWAEMESPKYCYEQAYLGLIKITAYEKGILYFQQPKNENNPDANYCLYVMMSQGLGVQANPELAEEYRKRAIELLNKQKKSQ